MTILCVNGWAQPPDGLQGIAADGFHFDYRGMQGFAMSSAAIKRAMPQATLAIGWSLGGAILMQAIASGALQAERLVLIAPVRQFVASPDAPWAMPLPTYRQFRQNYLAEPERTAARFAGLIAQGDDNGHYVRNACAWEGSADRASWGGWLETLGELRVPDTTPLPPTLLLHGAEDRIVRIESSRAWWHPAVKLVEYDACGHAPHLHDAAAVQEEIARHAG